MNVHWRIGRYFNLAKAIDWCAEIDFAGTKHDDWRRSMAQEGFVGKEQTREQGCVSRIQHVFRSGSAMTGEPNEETVRSDLEALEQMVNDALK